MIVLVYAKHINISYLLLSNHIILPNILLFQKPSTLFTREMATDYELIGHPNAQPIGHPYRSPLSDTPIGHPYRTPFIYDDFFRFDPSPTTTIILIGRALRLAVKNSSNERWTLFFKVLIL